MRIMKVSARQTKQGSVFQAEGTVCAQAQRWEHTFKFREEQALQGVRSGREVPTPVDGDER